MTTCNTCGQPLPDQPVYVGPGDRVKIDGDYGTVVGASPDDAKYTVVQFIGSRYRGVVTKWLTTSDDKPITGFKDPRDERIAELEDKLANHKRSAVLEDMGMALNREVELRGKRIEELEDELATTRESLADERLNAGTWQEAYTTLLENRREEEAEANPLAGLTDEQLTLLAREFARHCGYDPEAHVGGDMASLLRRLRDGKLEVPK